MALTIPNIFTDGTIADAVPMNANFAAVATAINTFGVGQNFAFSGASPFQSAAVSITAGSTAQIALQVIGLGTSEGDAFDVYTNSGGNLNLQVNASGQTLLSAGPNNTSLLVLGANAGTATTPAIVSNATGAIPSLIINAYGGGSTATGDLLQLVAGLPIAPTTYAKITNKGGMVPGNGVSAVGTAGVYSGTGVPSFSAPNGSMYYRYDGTGGSRVYVNTSGASTSGTTWTAVI